MAMNRIDSRMRDHMIHILKHKYPEIYEHYPCHGEFNQRFDRLINQGCQLEETVHRTAQRMIERDPDLRRATIARKDTDRATVNPYRGSIDYGGYCGTRSQHEMNMRNARLDSLAMGLMPPGRQSKPKKKKLTILEQLQADVDVWLKGSLNLT